MKLQTHSNKSSDFEITTMDLMQRTASICIFTVSTWLSPLGKIRTIGENICWVKYAHTVILFSCTKTADFKTDFNPNPYSWSIKRFPCVQRIRNNLSVKACNFWSRVNAPTENSMKLKHFNQHKSKWTNSLTISNWAWSFKLSHQRHHQTRLWYYSFGNFRICSG